MIIIVGARKFQNALRMAEHNRSTDDEKADHGKGGAGN